ncbi:MAG: transglutaminase domain-containing protein [Deltaproteobacteria bacterium]|nr:transglutaminase domain-containing protein [Deltaproteobacteria bacterium]
MQNCLKPTWYIDCDHPEIKKYNQTHLQGTGSAEEKAVKLFYLVRDGWPYNPYSINMGKHHFKASNILMQQFSFCIPKAVLLAALAREQGIPSRLGFADVRNHLSTQRFRELMKSDIYIYHGYTELYLHDRWVKVTTAFNKSLCNKFGVRPLEFDGRSDSIFHEYDTQGRRHMEYVRERGSYNDLPYEEIYQTFKKHYPDVFKFFENGGGGNFENEV